MNSADDLREEMAQQQATVRRTCGCWLWLLVVAAGCSRAGRPATTIPYVISNQLYSLM